VSECDWVPEEGGSFDDPDLVPGYGDGNFPPAVGAIMLDLLPPQLAEQYGRFVEGMMAGDQVEIAAETDAEAIVGELRQIGCSVVRDDAVVGSLW
jgi:hypothetical protein